MCIILGIAVDFVNCGLHTGVFSPGSLNPKIRITQIFGFSFGSSFLLPGKIVHNEISSQERCKHCALAVVRRSQKNFRPAADPLPLGSGRPKFNQLEMVTTITYRPGLVKIDAHNFELLW